MLTVAAVVIRPLVIVKPTEVDPAPIVTLADTVAADVLLLDDLTLREPSFLPLRHSELAFRWRC